MAKFEDTVKNLLPFFDEREKRQDSVLSLSREIVRLSAKAIKDLHSSDLSSARTSIAELQSKILAMKAIDKGFEHISSICYQEFTEISCLSAVFDRKDLPSHEDLGLEPVPYLNGVADVAGELRRAIQVSLAENRLEDAKYYFSRLEDVYDNLMLIKYSSSLVGQLRRKTDVARGQLEQARSEMLRYRSG